MHRFTGDVVKRNDAAQIIALGNNPDQYVLIPAGPSILDDASITGIRDLVAEFIRDKSPGKPRKLIFNLNVAHMDTSFLPVIIDAHQQLSAQGESIAVVAAERIVNAFKSANLDKLFQVTDLMKVGVAAPGAKVERA